MSSRLLPGRTQVATPDNFTHGEAGSNLALKGSRRVAGWVAGWTWRIFLTYAVEKIRGSRCSTFHKKLRIRNRREGKERIGITIGISCYTCYPKVQINRPDGAA